jgi:hypothetical protein
MLALSDVARWLMAVPTGLLFALCVIDNWSVIVAWLDEWPFLGPVFGLIFLVAVPILGAVRYWWVVPLAEPTWLIGSVAVLTVGVTKLIRSRGGSHCDSADPPAAGR